MRRKTISAVMIHWTRQKAGQASLALSGKRDENR